MNYRISFVPKKTGNAIPPKANEHLTKMFEAIRDYIRNPEKKHSDDALGSGKGAEALWGQIKFQASQVIEFSNLRTICAPEAGLKEKQRGLLRVLERIPVHRSAHGFVRYRDSKTCASAHTRYWGSKANHLVVLNMDAKNFFHSVTSPDVRRALEAHRIAPKNITEIIDICMVRANEEMAVAVVWGLTEFLRRRNAMTTALNDTIDMIVRCLRDGVVPGVSVPVAFVKKLAFVICQNFLSTGSGVTTQTRFLPQGAPTSPFLSNLAMKLVDIRLTGLAKKFNGFYTRYADDLTVSWIAPTKGKIIDGMYRCTQEILKEYHIALNRRKKRVMGRGKRQDIVGYCINSGKPTISQKYRKKFRAAIHNEMVRGSKRLKEGKRQAFPGEDYKGIAPSLQRQSVLRGFIGYIQTAHPEEADRHVRKLEHICNRSPRTLGGISDIIAEQTIEVSITPGTERVLGD